MANTKSKDKEQFSEGGELLVKLKRPELSNPQTFSVYKDDDGKVHQFMDINGRPASVTFVEPTTKLYYDKPSDKKKIDFIVGYSKSKSWLKRREGIEIIDKVNDAKSKNTERMERSKAEAAILKYIEEKRLRELGHLLNIFTLVKSKTLDGDPLMNEVYLVLDKKSGKGAAEILKLTNSPDKDYIITFNKGVLHGIFKYNAKDSLYRYNEMPIGRSADECVLWFKENADVYALLEADMKALA